MRRVPLPTSLLLQPLPGPWSCPQEPEGGQEDRVGQNVGWPSPLGYRIVCVPALSMLLTSLGTLWARSPGVVQTHRREWTLRTRELMPLSFL